MFTKGTRVRVKTTNGGEAVGVLAKTFTGGTGVEFAKIFAAYRVNNSIVTNVKKVEVVYA
jgi:hypothetical protein